MELIRNDSINVDYILDLLENLDIDGKSFEKDKERIINIMKQTESLRSKIGLIEKFIDYRLPTLDAQIAIREEFDRFMKTERNNAIGDLISKENLNRDIACQIFDKYLFSEKFDDDLIKKSFNDKLKFIERKTKLNSVKNQIRDLFERFDY